MRTIPVAISQSGVCLCLPVCLVVLLASLLLHCASASTERRGDGRPPAADSAEFRNTLMEFYNAVREESPSWPFDNWGSNYLDPCQGWSGIECTGATRRLLLRSSDLQGTLPESLFSLGFTEIDLAYNLLSGPLPRNISWGIMTAGKEGHNIDLSNNQFEGTIPETWGSTSSPGSSTSTLWDVKQDSVYSAGGEEATFPLLTIDLSKNKLTGPLPSSWKPPPRGEATNVTFAFHLAHNKLGGSLTGSFFSAIVGHCAHLDLRNNSFSGALPRGVTVPPGASKPFSARYRGMDIDVSNNALKDEIDDTLFFGPANNAELVRSLNMSHNRLNATFDGCYVLLRLRGGLDLSHNEISGGLSDLLVGESPNSNLTIVDVSHNQLTGPFPFLNGSTAGWKLIDASHNLLSGRLEGDWSYGGSYSLAHNDLHGSLPRRIFSSRDTERGREIVLDHNRFGGQITAKHFCDPSTDGSWCGGELKNRVAYLSKQRLQVVSVAHNNLSGPFPTQLVGGLCGSCEVDLSFNQFTGPLENAQHRLNMTGVRKLSVSNNQLNGTIPDSFDFSTYGSTLFSFSGNDFVTADNVTIPQWLYVDMRLSVDLSSNPNFVGTFQHCIEASFLNVSATRVFGAPYVEYTDSQYMLETDVKTVVVGATVSPTVDLSTVVAKEVRWGLESSESFGLGTTWIGEGFVILPRLGQNQTGNEGSASSSQSTDGVIQFSNCLQEDPVVLKDWYPLDRMLTTTTEGSKKQRPLSERSDGIYSIAVDYPQRVAALRDAATKACARNPVEKKLYLAQLQGLLFSWSNGTLSFGVLATRDHVPQTLGGEVVLVPSLQVDSIPTWFCLFTARRPQSAPTWFAHDEQLAREAILYTVTLSPLGGVVLTVAPPLSSANKTSNISSVLEVYVLFLSFQFSDTNSSVVNITDALTPELTALIPSAQTTKGQQIGWNTWLYVPATSALVVQCNSYEDDGGLLVEELSFHASVCAPETCHLNNLVDGTLVTFALSPWTEFPQVPSVWSQPNGTLHISVTYETSLTNNVPLVANATLLYLLLGVRCQEMSICDVLGSLASFKPVPCELSIPVKLTTFLVTPTPLVPGGISRLCRKSRSSTDGSGFVLKFYVGPSSTTCTLGVTGSEQKLLGEIPFGPSFLEGNLVPGFSSRCSYIQRPDMLARKIADLATPEQPRTLFPYDDVTTGMVCSSTEKENWKGLTFFSDKGGLVEWDSSSCDLVHALTDALRKPVCYVSTSYAWMIIQHIIHGNDGMQLNRRVMPTQADLEVAELDSSLRYSQSESGSVVAPLHDAQAFVYEAMGKSNIWPWSNSIIRHVDAKVLQSKNLTFISGIWNGNAHSLQFVMNRTALQVAIARNSNSTSTNTSTPTPEDTGGTNNEPEVISLTFSNDACSQLNAIARCPPLLIQPVYQTFSTLSLPSPLGGFYSRARSVRYRPSAASGTAWRKSFLPLGKPVSVTELRTENAPGVPQCRATTNSDLVKNWSLPLCPQWCVDSSDCTPEAATRKLTHFLYLLWNRGNNLSAVANQFMRSALCIDAPAYWNSTVQFVEGLAPTVTGYCTESKKVYLIAAGESIEVPFVLATFDDGVADPFYQVTFECSTCDPFYAPGFNPQPFLLLGFASIKSLVVVILSFLFVRKFPRATRRVAIGYAWLLSNLAGFRSPEHKQYFYSVVVANFAPKRLSDKGLRDRLEYILDSPVHDEFPDYFASHLSCNGTVVPDPKYARHTPDIVYALTLLRDAHQELLNAQAQGDYDVESQPSLGSHRTVKGRESLSKAEGDGEGDYLLLEPRSSGSGVQFSEARMKAILKTAKDTLEEHRTSGGELVMLDSYVVVHALTPMPWVVMGNFIWCVVILLTSFVSAIQRREEFRVQDGLGWAVYEAAYFRFLNSTAAASLMVSASALGTLRKVPWRRNTFIISCLVLMAPALLSNVLVGLLLFSPVLMPPLVLAVGFEYLVERFAQKHHREKHLLTFVLCSASRLLLVFVVAAVLSLSYNYGVLYLYKCDGESSGVDVTYWQTVRRDYAARSVACTLEQLFHSLGSAAQGLGSIVGLF